MFAGGGTASAGVAPRIAALQERALALQLHERRYWQVLLHYEKAGSGVESLVDDPGFFFASQGKSDPRAELLATLQALFEPVVPGTPDPRCRFVARLAWLENELGLPETDPAEIPCPEYAAARWQVTPQSATLVFPGSYANSPASMFGHTLLNFSGPYQSKPLAHAASYSAFTDENNGLLYAVRGITGGYRGYFTLLPYYEKIKEYSGLERRDMWEYRLRLTSAETARMFRHLWELREIYSDYFFFDENCSSNLLYLLEAARPELDLTDPDRWWVLPIDTVRLLDQHGLIAAAEYRPSLATRLRRKAERLNAEETAAAQGLVRGAEPALLAQWQPASAARVLETAAEAIELRYVQRKLDLQTYRQRYLAVLAARSRLGLLSQEAPPEEAPLRPDFGHGSVRLGVGIGVDDSRWFQEWRLRPVYHSLLDPAEGFLAGSQIVLGDLVLRVEPTAGTLRLEHFRLVDIVSLAPVDAFDAPISWQARIGARRLALAGDDPLALYVNPGGGLARQSAWGLWYALLETEGLVSGALRENLALGFGASVGWLQQWGDRWQVHAQVRQLHYLPQGDYRFFSAEISQGWKLSRQNSLTLELIRQVERQDWTTRGTLLWHHFW